MSGPRLKWNYTAGNGKGLRAAYEYMLPYVNVPPKEWEHEQIKEKKEESYLPLLKEASLALDSSEMADVLAKYEDAANQRFNLLFLK